jgi:PAS domain S-box-containing protein
MEQNTIPDRDGVRLPTRTGSGRLKPWQAYMFAVAVTTATLALRLALDGQLPGRPTLIVFTVPIMLSAYVGGLRAGLLATALSYLGASFYLLPPFNGFRAASAVDRWDIFFVTLAGVVISVLNEALHRAHRLADIAAREEQARVAVVNAGILQSAIFNSANFSCIATDARGVIQLFNVGSERMFGYLAAEVINRITPAALHDPQEVILRATLLSLELGTTIVPGFEALVYKASRGIEDIYEVTKVRKDGSRFPALLSVTALRDPQNTIIGYLLIATDNTLRKLAEEERKRFFALSQDVFCILGFDGHFKDLNEVWEKIIGFTKAELLATPFIEFIHPDDRQATLAEAEQVAGGKRLTAFENRYLCKNGSYRWFQWNVTPVLKDRVMYGVARDVTERKQEEATLLKAGALQSAIFNSANFSSIATDAKGVIQIFNVGAERMLGYAATDVLNKITPAEISDPQEVIARAGALTVELGTPITPGFEALVFKASRGIEDIYELTYIRKDGSRFPAVVSVTALRDAQGGIIGYLLIGTDNTARKRAEEALLKAGALQNAIFNSANFSSIATDAKGVIQIFNVGAERMLGYTAADVMNKITPADISDPQEVIARAEALTVELGTPIAPGFEALVFKASRGIEDIYELTYIRKDSTRFPAIVSVTALRDAQGGIIGYLLIGTDNTARKRAEEALLKAGALQNAIFHSANFSCIATDAKGVIQLFNVGAERMLGYMANEVLNKITPAELHDAQEVIARATALSLELGTTIAPGFEALAFKASRGIEDIYELTKIRKDGSRFPAVVSVTALRDAQDGIIGYLLIGTDNTARQQVEAERMTAQRELSDVRAAIDQHAIVAITDSKGKITYVNDKFCAISKFSREELQGRDHRIVNSGIHPKEFMRSMWQTISAGRVWQGEIMNKAKDGTFYWVDNTIVPYFGEDGKSLQYISIRTDITERKRFEQALQETNTKLERAKSAAEKANQAKSDFLANMSHELRTPLNAIIGFSEILTDRTFGGLNDRQLKYTNNILGSGRHLLQLINDILDLAKVEAGHVALVRNTFSVATALSEVQTIVKTMANKKNIALDFWSAPGMPSLFAEEAKFKQIMYNLLSNAIKFTPDGGKIFVTADLQDPAGAEVNPTNQALRVAVADNGIGIKLNDQLRVFKEFEQVDSSYGREQQGTGLGLALTQRLVKMHDGHVWVESEGVEGKGSTFTFLIPMLKAEAGAVALPDEPNSRHDIIRPLVDEAVGIGENA